MKSNMLPTLYIRLFFIVSFILFSCSNNDDDVATSQSINDFVWKGLNSWYYWQEEVPNLSDDYGTQSGYLDFVNSYNNTSDFFYSLLYDYPNIDRFSWIVSDYNQLLSSFQGSSFSTGFDFGLVRISEGSEEVFGYVRYVLPNTQAEMNGIQRGDIFTRVNGTQLTTNNYIDLLYGSSSYTIGLADYIDENNIIDNGETKQVVTENITENPVFYRNVYEVGSKRVGYLVYNAFTFTFNGELNDAFAYFQQENITDFILDLRYNGGGSVATASFLASMINGNQNGNVFAKLIFNSKHQNSNRNYNFSNQVQLYNSNGTAAGTAPTNSLNLSKVIVLTTFSTASASELIINGLSPYIEVQTIGRTTRGKDNGSITLYDDPSSDYTNVDNANSAHTWAMQPLVFKTFNANDEGDYSAGFAPDIEVNELDNLDNFLPLGNPNEVMLSTALNVLSGGIAPPTQPTDPFQTQFTLFKDRKDNILLGKDMYIH